MTSHPPDRPSQFDLQRNPSLQCLVDRMVDGELTHGEQRLLLHQLESEPSGWRTLALAYVEAQSLSHDFRTLLPQSQPGKTIPVTTPAAPRRPVSSQSIFLVAACCLGVVLGSGLTWQQIQTRRTVAAPGGVTTGEASATVQRAAVPQTPAKQTVPDTAGQHAAGNPSRPRIPVVNVSTNPPKARPTVKVESSNAAWPGVEVPLMDASEVSPDWLNSRGGGLSPQFRESVRRGGRDVEATRRLVPFQLEDGRWGLIPVDEVRFVDRKEFH